MIMKNPLPDGLEKATPCAATPTAALQKNYAPAVTILNEKNKKNSTNRRGKSGRQR
jgi:hypothetical protein